MVEELYDDLHDAMSEMILLGNIINRIELVGEYSDCLCDEDFTDKANRKLWQFLKEYYREYGAGELEEMKVNAKYLEMLARLKFKFDYEYHKKPFKLVKEYGGLGSAAPADNEAFKRVKKMSLLRQLDKIGYDVAPIIAQEDFWLLCAEDVEQIIYGKVDEAMSLSKLHPRADLSKDFKQRALGFLEEPEVGLQTPFPFINDYMHGLCKNDMILIGGISNSGKGRLLMTLLTWLVVYEGQTVCLLSNEMTEADFFKCLVCTVVNMNDAHGKVLKLSQGDIVQNRFKDEAGEYIERHEDELTDEFKDRLMQNSPEFRDYMDVLDWWEQNFTDHFRFVNVADNYSTERLKHEIRLATATGCSVVAYDTLKGYQSTEWGDMVQATTDLSELIKSDKNGVIGLATFQLTNDVQFSAPEDLTSAKIANAKNIIHLADGMIMFMQLNDHQKRQYQVTSKELKELWGEETCEEIPPGANIAAFRIIKNRRGSGKDKIFAVQNNLDRNYWIQLGDLVREKAG